MRVRPQALDPPVLAFYDGAAHTPAASTDCRRMGRYVHAFGAAGFDCCCSLSFWLPRRRRTGRAKQPIKIVVPFSAGSATDITARTVFEQVGRQIGQTFVVENRGGAGTTLGSGMVAKAEPDGYTLLVNSTSHVVVASTYAKLPFSVADDFAAVSALASIPFVVATATKYKTLKDLIDAGKKPGSSDPLRHRRRRQLRAAVHGALAARRRISGDARAVPRHARGHDRGDRRPHRPVSGARGECDRARQGRQDQRARGQLAASGCR